MLWPCVVCVPTIIPCSVVVHLTSNAFVALPVVQCPDFERQSSSDIEILSFRSSPALLPSCSPLPSSHPLISVKTARVNGRQLTANTLLLLLYRLGQDRRTDRAITHDWLLDLPLHSLIGCSTASTTKTMPRIERVSLPWGLVIVIIPIYLNPCAWLDMLWDRSSATSTAVENEQTFGLTVHLSSCPWSPFFLSSTDWPPHRPSNNYLSIRTIDHLRVVVYVASSYVIISHLCTASGRWSEALHCMRGTYSYRSMLRKGNKYLSPIYLLRNRN